MKTMALTDSAEEELGILQIEEKMRGLGLRIEGYNLSIIVKGTLYKIGKDRDCFPRDTDEPFWRRSYDIV